MIQSIPATWRNVKLGELTQNIERANPSDKFTGKFNYIDITAVDNVLKQVIGKLDQEVAEAPSRARQIVYPGDILVSTVRPGLNAVAMVPSGLSDAVASTGFCVLRTKPDVLLGEYLFHFVTTKPFVQSLVSREKGGAYPAVTDGDVRSVPISIPPLSEQRRIVEILQEAEQIRRLRAQAESKTRELIPSIFAAIFGDLYFGKSPFPLQPLSAIGELDRGKSKHRPRDESSLYGGPYPFIQTGDVAQANGWITSYTQTYSEKGLEQSRLWLKGTLVITIAANIGSTAILTFDACFPDSVVGFAPNEGVSVEYVRWWLLGYQKKLEMQAAQGAQKNINLDVLRKIQIPVPPAKLQLKFQAAIQNIREQIDSTSTGDKTLSALAASLSAHAFSGQLTANWRETHKQTLAREAHERDATLRQAGAKLIQPRPEIANVVQAPITERLQRLRFELSHEQIKLLDFISIWAIHKQVKGPQGESRPVYYFTASLLAKEVPEDLQDLNPQVIEGHLTVLATRGLIIPVSREEQTEDTAKFIFGNAYRLPFQGDETSLVTENGDALMTEQGDVVVMEQGAGDYARLREMERLAAQLEKERALT